MSDQLHTVCILPGPRKHFCLTVPAVPLSRYLGAQLHFHRVRVRARYNGPSKFPELGIPERAAVHITYIAAKRIPELAHETAHNILLHIRRTTTSMIIIYYLPGTRASTRLTPLPLT